MMKSLVWFLGVLCCCLVVSPLSAQESTYQVQVRQQPLKQVIQQLEEVYQLSFSYEEAAVADVYVTLDLRTTSLDELLRGILAQTELDYQQVDRQFVMLVPRAVSPQVVPVYQLCGYVQDSVSGLPLVYASAYLLQQQVGGETDENGFFSFRAAVAVTDTIVISYVGYQEKRFQVADFLQTDCGSINLSMQFFEENLIIVTDYLTQGINLGKQGFATQVRPAELPALPGQVAPDVLETLQFLPGISSPDGKLDNIHMRGSTPDQNLILWEDIPIYYSAHYFGSISAFNPFLVDEVQVFRGGFGAEYGGRIAGVIDLGTAVIGDPGWSGGAGSNLYSGFAYGRFTDPKKRHGVGLSLRRSLTGGWQSPFFQQLRNRSQQEVLRGNFTLDNLPPGLAFSDDFQFWDTQIKYTARLSSIDELQVAGLFAANQFNNQISDANRQQDHFDELDLRHLGGKIEWNRQWTPEWHSSVLLSATNYDYNYNFIQDFWNPMRTDGGGRRDNEIQEQQLRLTNTFFTPGQASFKGGFQYTAYQNEFLIIAKDEEVNLANQDGGGQTELYTLFGTYTTPEDRKMGMRAGLRANVYSVDQQLYWEPRLELWRRLGNDFRLQFAAGRYYQFLSQLVEFKGAKIGISSPIWVLADGQQVVPLAATQLQAGLIYNRKSWLLDLQLYHKRSKGLSGLSVGFVPSAQQGFARGDANVLGFDLLVKKRWGAFSSWLSYSLSEVEYEFPTFFDPEFYASFDQRHQLNWANVWQSNRWTISLGWQWSSGLPYSVMRDFRLRPSPSGTGNVVEPIYSAYNDQRLPACHQLNASIMYELRTRRHPGWSTVIGLSLINIYDQDNYYEREYFVDNRVDAPRHILFEENKNLGFVPNFMVRMEWK